MTPHTSRAEPAGTSDTRSTVSWEELRDASLAAMSQPHRAEYGAAAIEAEARLQLAELVYQSLLAKWLL